jgi:hypothetical protein
VFIYKKPKKKANEKTQRKRNVRYSSKLHEVIHCILDQSWRIFVYFAPVDLDVVFFDDVLVSACDVPSLFFGNNIYERK